jgi:RHS repeat-associated protein
VQEISGTSASSNLLTGGVDEYFQRTDLAGARSFLTDAFGSTLALADSSGTLQTTYTFEPFGSTSVTGTATTNSFAYTGRELDPTGLYYYRARYYSPALQRFIGEDPIGFNGGINLYSYAYDAPTVFRDPSGHGPGSLVVAGGGSGVTVTTTITVTEIGSAGSAPELSLIAGGSAAGGATGTALAAGGLVGVIAVAAIIDAYEIHDLGVAYGWWGPGSSPAPAPSCGNPSPSPSPKPPMAGRKGEPSNKSFCWLIDHFTDPDVDPKYSICVYECEDGRIRYIPWVTRDGCPSTLEW